MKVFPIFPLFITPEFSFYNISKTQRENKNPEKNENIFDTLLGMSFCPNQLRPPTPAPTVCFPRWQRTTENSP